MTKEAKYYEKIVVFDKFLENAKIWQNLIFQ